MRVRNSPTPAQQKVLALVCEGRTNKEIGRVLGISPLTVKGHIKLLLDTLQLPPLRRTRTALAVIYKRWQDGEQIPGWNRQPDAKT